MKHQSILFSFALLMAGCAQTTPVTGDVEINPQAATEVLFEDVACNIKVVPIKSDEPLHDCSYFRCYGDELIMIDTQKKWIYYFKDNELQGTLHSLGRGPGEYNMIDFYEYDSKGKILYVVSLAESDAIMSYSVPDMKYTGKLNVGKGVECIRIYDENTLLLGVKEGDGGALVLFDIPSQTIKETICELTGNELAYTDRSIFDDGDGCMFVAKYGVASTISELKDGRLNSMLNYDFGRDGAEQVYYNDLKDAIDADAYISYIFSPDNDAKFTGGKFIRQNGSGLSFWYSTLLGSEKNYRYFRIDGDKQVHLKGFGVPGLKKPIVPSCSTSDGYVTIISGDAESLADTSVEASPLAKEILKTISLLVDNYMVVVYYDIK